MEEPRRNRLFEIADRISLSREFHILPGSTPKLAAKSMCQIDDSKFLDGLPLQAKDSLPRLEKNPEIRIPTNFCVEGKDGWE